MKLNKRESLIWLDQAEHNLKVAKNNFKCGFFSDACFMSEQTAQVILKAFIIFHKKRYIWEHSIQELVRISCDYNKNFEKFIDYGKILDKYYIPTRYPNALAQPAIPYKSFTEKEAEEAVGYVEEIVGFVKKILMEEKE